MSYVSESKRSESSASRRSIDGDTAEEGDDRDETKRRSRNLSEKKRRDQFNVLINELCSMVSSTPRKMDKSTVLKATISFLKAHNELSVQSQVQEIQEDWKPSFLSNEEFTYLMLEALDGFIMVISSSGKIIYVSESVTSLLGHLTTDLLNTSLYDFVPSEERSGLFNVLSVQAEEKSKNFSSIILNIRLGGLEIDEDVQKHQLVKLTGYIKSWISADCCDSDDFEMNDESLSEDFETTCLTKYVFVCTGRLLESDLLREMSVVVDSANTEFSSRHSLEWKFLFLDHRAPPIIGYLPFEVLGTSGYDYYHIEDLEKIANCHETLMQKGEGTSCYYRFLTKGQQWIWLQTRYYITYHQWNSKPEFIVGTHRVVSYADVLKELRGAKSAKHAPKLSQQNNLKIAKLELKNKSSTGSSRSSSKLRLSEHLTLNSSSSKRSSSIKKVEPPPKFSNYNQNCHYKGGSSPGMPISHFTIHPNTPFVQHNRIGQAVQPSQTPAPTAMALPLATFHLKQLGSQYAFTGTNTLHSAPLVTSSAPINQGLLILNSQNSLQEQLLMKHAEIQRKIMQQQEELRRVSEQLLINSQCGLVPAESTPILLPPTSQPQLSHNMQQPMDDSSLQLQQSTGYPNFLQYPTNVMGFSQISQSGPGDGSM